MKTTKEIKRFKRAQARRMRKHPLARMSHALRQTAFDNDLPLKIVRLKALHIEDIMGIPYISKES